MLERDRGGGWCGTGGWGILPKVAAGPLTPPRSHRCPRPPGDTRGGDTAPELPGAAGTTAGPQGGGREFGDASRAAHPSPRRSSASRSSPTTNRQLPKTEGKVWRGVGKRWKLSRKKNSSPCLPWHGREPGLEAQVPNPHRGTEGQRDRGTEVRPHARAALAPRHRHPDPPLGPEFRGCATDPGGKSQFRAVP